MITRKEMNCFPAVFLFFLVVSFFLSAGDQAGCLFSLHPSSPLFFFCSPSVNSLPNLSFFLFPVLRLLCSNCNKSKWKKYNKINNNNNNKGQKKYVNQVDQYSKSCNGLLDCYSAGRDKRKNLKKKWVVHQNDTEAAVVQFNMVHYCKVLKMMSSDLHDFQTFSVCA